MYVTIHLLSEVTRRSVDTLTFSTSLAGRQLQCYVLSRLTLRQHLGTIPSSRFNSERRHKPWL